MKKSSAILILETFSKEELDMFGEFLHSPFHNKNTKVLRLYNILKKHYPFNDLSKISKPILFREMFREKNYSESYIRNLLSDLNLLAEKFLRILRFEKDPESEKRLITEFSRRNIHKFLLKKLNDFEKSIENEPAKDHDFYWHKIFIYDMKGLSVSDRSLTNKFMPDAISAKIKLSLLMIMESYFQFLVEEQRIKVKHNYDYLVHTLSYLKNRISEFSDSPLLMVYYYLWMSFLGSNDENSFVKARKIFNAEFRTFTITDKKNIYAVMKTFCLKKIDEGCDSYERVLLNLLLEMLRRNVTSHRENYINLNLYRNILLTCFKLNDLKMLKSFITAYLKYTDPDCFENIRIYSEAHKEFLKGNFADALQLASKVNFRNLFISAGETFYFKNDIKSVILKCLYELDYFESAFNHIDSYKHFLNNSSLIKDSLKKKYLKFINATSVLIKLKTDYAEFSHHKLKKSLSENNDIVSKVWLLDKLSEIKK